MVRSITGTLVDMGLGRRRAGEMLGIVRSLDRAQAGRVAPPEGLTLWEVRYDGPRGRFEERTGSIPAVAVEAPEIS
jgi:tRNA pseudouridine38-40 synthase